MDECEELDLQHSSPIQNPLPISVTIEMAFQRMGKPIGQPDQFPLDPRVSFEQFREELTQNVAETIGFEEDEEKIAFSWKWEKRATQTTAAKKAALPYAILSRDRHWDAIQQALREANGVKKGCHNMLLRILASITSKDDESVPGQPLQNDGTVREVITLCALVNCSPQPLDSMHALLQCLTINMTRLFAIFKPVIVVQTATQVGHVFVGSNSSKDGQRFLIFSWILV